MRGKKAREIRAALYGDDMSIRFRTYSSTKGETTYWVMEPNGELRQVDADYQPGLGETFFKRTPITVKADKRRQMYQFLKHPDRHGRIRRDLEVTVALSHMSEEDIRARAKDAGQDAEAAVLSHKGAVAFGPFCQEVLDRACA